MVSVAVFYGVAMATGSELNRLISELARIPHGRERREFLLRNRALHDREAVNLLYDESVRLARVDVREADRLAQGLAWIAGKTKDDYCRAQGLRAAGHVRLVRGKYADAVRCYRDALLLFRRVGTEVEIGRTLYGGSLQALMYLGQYDQAFAWAQEAREIFERAGDRLRLARLDSNMANVLYRQDHFDQAIEYYRRAVDEFERQGEPQDMAIALRNMAVCYISLAEFEQALETYRRARALCEQNGLHLLVAEVDYNIAYLHYQRGEYTLAISLYQSTRKHCEALGDPYHRALCDLDQAEMYLELNLDREGAQLAEQAAAAFKDLRMRYEEAKALAFLAIAAGHQHQTTRSLRLFGNARRLFLREGNQVWVALIDLYQAVVFSQSGRHDLARDLCDRALAVFSDAHLSHKSALCELLLARLKLAEGDHCGAESLCLAALDRLDETGFPALCCQAHLVLGQIREARHDRRLALKSYRRAHALLEDVRSLLRGEELKIAFLKDKLAVYESLVWMYTSARSGRNHEAAFACIEQAKSRSLADMIAVRNLDIPSSGDPRDSLRKRVRLLRKDLNWWYRQIDLREKRPDVWSPDSNRILQRRARDCEDQLVRALTELNSQDKRFGVLQNAGTMSLEAIRSILPDDRVVLEYYRARDELYACVLGRDTLEIVPLGKAAAVQSRFRLLQFQLSKFKLGAQYLERFSDTVAAATHAHLLELHQALITPVWKWLREKHVVVVPHDFLHCLPFHALHNGRNHLIDETRISYAPSASIYYLCCTRKPDANSRSLILGVPDPLAPHILDEVREVAALLPDPTLLIGEEATERALRACAPSSRFVHIATHGLFRQDNPMFSSMRLGDCLLSLIDLYSLSLSSDLVTLSGCSTGLNAIVGGDELLGMVRGLLFAGSRAVLVSLWDVDDRSTAAFMAAFYRHLIAEKEIAVAMQMTVREMREVYPHPHQWAPFMAIGKTELM